MTLRERILDAASPPAKSLMLSREWAIANAENARLLPLLTALAQVAGAAALAQEYLEPRLAHAPASRGATIVLPKLREKLTALEALVGAGSAK